MDPIIHRIPPFTTSTPASPNPHKQPSKEDSLDYPPHTPLTWKHHKYSYSHPPATFFKYYVHPQSWSNCENAHS
jgi:hypothetical protein